MALEQKTSLLELTDHREHRLKNPSLVCAINTHYVQCNENIFPSIISKYFI